MLSVKESPGEVISGRDEEIDAAGGRYAAAITSPRGVSTRRKGGTERKTGKERGSPSHRSYCTGPQLQQKVHPQLKTTNNLQKF